MTWDAFSWPTLIVLTYLLGSTPTAYLVTRLVKGQDIRRLGDGNPGAENVARILGTRFGLAVGVVDISKGAAAVLLAQGLMDSLAADMAAGVMAVAGHNWSVFLGGQGGKGAATAVGVFLAFMPLPAIPLGLLALVMLRFTRSTTGAIAFFLIPLPFLAAWPLGYSYPVIGYAVGLPVLVGLSHLASSKMPLPFRGARREDSALP